MFKKFTVALVLVSLVIPMTLLSGCATSNKIQAVQVGDNELTKNQLLAEIRKLDDAQQQVDGNKGVTGTNVAAALFWLPGLAYTYYDAGEATRLINERRAHLTNIYNQKFGQDEKAVASAKAKSPAKSKKKSA